MGSRSDAAAGNLSFQLLRFASLARCNKSISAVCI
jgi:hypothetical protein